MKKLVLRSLILSISLAGCQPVQEGYKINGEVIGMEDGMIYLKSFRNKMFFNMDSTRIQNGKFTFTGNTEMPLLYGLATESMSYPAQFFLENTTMDIKLDAEEGSIESIVAADENKIFFENQDKVFEEGFNIDSLITKYPSSPAAAFYLYRYFTYQLSIDDLKATRSKISEGLSRCPYVMDLDKIIAKLENVQIGKSAPLFSLPDTAGNSVALSDFKGKYLLIDFWASWCGPCRRENPNVVKAYQKYKDENFAILGVSLDFNKDNWIKAINDDNLTWTHISDLKFWDSAVPDLYAVRGIPANVLIDPEGIIIARNVYGNELQEKLEEVLK